MIRTLFALVFLSACASSEWSRASSQVHSNPLRIVGIGRADAIQNEFLRRSTADNRARAEVDRLFDDCLRRRLDVPRPAGAAGASVDGDVVMKEIYRARASAVSIDRRRDKDGVAWAAAVLEVEVFLANLSKREGVPEATLIDLRQAFRRCAS